MFVFPAGKQGGYEITNSLRFDGSNDYLTRTPASAGNRSVWTWSGWIKRSKLGVTSGFFGAGLTSVGSGTTYLTGLVFTAADALAFYWGNSGGPIGTTTAVYRDVSSHMHVVAVANTTTFKIYVNGTEVLSSAISGQGAVNNTQIHTLGAWWDTGGGVSFVNSGLYQSEINFIDGQALDPSYFGETNPATDQWVPKKYTGTYGTNGFYLDFKDGSSTTTLGYDAAGSNDWTLTNMVRDGSVEDCWSYDTPTNNYATWNPLIAASTGLGTLSKGALRCITPTSGASNNYGTVGQSSGKFYWEVTVTSRTTDSNVMIGINDNTQSATEFYSQTRGYAYRGNGEKWNNGAGSAYGSAAAAGDIIGVAFDASGGTLEFYKNGVSMGVAYSGITSSEYMSAICDTGTTVSWTADANFGQRPVTSGQWYPDAKGYFRYAPPTGYKALCTANITDTNVIESGSFTGNAAADGPFVWCNGTPETLTIDGNAVTFGTHADKLSNGFKIRTASSPYNDAATNNWTCTVKSPELKSAFKYQNAKGNP